VEKTNSKLVLPATDPHGFAAENRGVRNAEIVLNRCKVLDSEGEGDKGMGRFAGKSLRQKWKV